MNTKKVAVSTRFHSWAENDFSSSLDLNELLIHHPAATFFIRVKGDGLQADGIYAHDILVVDRSLSLSNHKLIVARLDGQLIVRRVLFSGGNILLTGDANEINPIIITADRDFEVWGVVSAIVRQM